MTLNKIFTKREIVCLVTALSNRRDEITEGIEEVTSEMKALTNLVTSKSSIVKKKVEHPYNSKKGKVNLMSAFMIHKIALAELNKELLFNQLTLGKLEVIDDQLKK